MNVKLTKIHRGKNGRERFVYAELTEENGDLLVSATLDYCLRACLERGYNVNSLDVQGLVEIFDKTPLT